MEKQDKTLDSPKKILNRIGKRSRRNDNNNVNNSSNEYGL